MAGFNSSTVYANNVDFTGSTQPSPQVLLDGQLLIGSSVAPKIRVATLTAGTGVSITNAAGSITIGLSGSGVALEHLTGNSGGVLNPDGSNNINTLGTGSITIAGVGSTLTTQLTGLTSNAILIGAGTATITKLGPTNRAVLTSGATGIPALTALATDGQLIIGSTAGAPAAASLSAGTGISITPGSNSISIATSAALSAFNSVVVQVFTGNGTYTPTAGMKYATLEVQAGGAGGGGAAASGATTGAVGGAGGAGGYARKTVTAATIGASQAVTVGGTAAGATAGSNAGTTGNSSSVGAIVTASGGVGGLASGVASGFSTTQGSNGGVGASGDFNIHGGAGDPSFQGFFTGIAQLIMTGTGGNSIFGAGGAGLTTTAALSAPGNNAVTYGGGGGGGVSTGNSAAAAGGDGAAGIVVITEYISV